MLSYLYIIKIITKDFGSWKFLPIDILDILDGFIIRIIPYHDTIPDEVYILKYVQHYDYGYENG
jgi:hypothetical protein